MEAHTHRAPSVTSPGGLRIELQRDTGRCDGFPFLNLDDPAVVHFFGELRKEYLASRPQQESVSEWDPPRPYHGDASFCEYNGQFTASDFETDTEELMEGVNLLQAGKVKVGKMLKTVRRNFEGWTKRDISEAHLARTLQSRVGNMPDEKLKQMVSVNGLRNSPVRPEHVSNATRIFGPNVAALEGKTVRRPSPRVHTDKGVSIPNDFYRLHHFVTLVADVFYVNGVTFLMTLSRKIKLYTAEHIPSRKACVLADSLKR